MFSRFISKYLILFKTNKLRFTLTIFGIFIGGLIFLSGRVITDSMEQEMLDVISEFPSDTIIYSDVSLSSYKYLDRIGGTEYLVPYYRERISYTSEVDEAVYDITYDFVATTNVFFQTGVPYNDGLSISQISFQNGRVWSVEEANDNAMVVVISNYVAEFYFADKDPLGQYLNIPGMGSFKIIGIYNDTIEFKQQKQDLVNIESNNDTVFLPDLDMIIPISTYLHIKNTEMTVIPYVVQTHSDAYAVSTAIESTLPSSSLDDLNNHVTRQSMLDLISTQLENYRSIFTIVFIVSILLSGIIIMNTMFFSVKERFLEIGLRVSLGASKMDILKQFVMESMILSFIGAVITIAFVQFVVVIVNLSLSTSFHLVLYQDASLLYIVICILQSLIFCLAPAFYATKINVIDALKFE